MNDDSSTPAEMERRILAAVDRMRASGRWYTLAEVCAETGVDLETLRSMIEAAQSEGR